MHFLDCSGFLLSGSSGARLGPRSEAVRSGPILPSSSRARFRTARLAAPKTTGIESRSGRAGLESHVLVQLSLRGGPPAACGLLYSFAEGQGPRSVLFFISPWGRGRAKLCSGSWVCMPQNVSRSAVPRSLSSRSCGQGCHRKIKSILPASHVTHAPGAVVGQHISQPRYVSRTIESRRWGNSSHQGRVADVDSRVGRT